LLAVAQRLRDGNARALPDDHQLRLQPESAALINTDLLKSF
jgi:hypothetical protein